MSDGLQEARNAFLRKLIAAIKSHFRWCRFDAGLHQFLVIGAAIAGFASLYAGTMGDNPKLAGVIGALTSVATILAQQLHCVKAINWHNRMAVELEIVRDKFEDKYSSAPTDEELAALSQEVAELKLRMLDAWEKATASGPVDFGKSPRGNARP